MTTATKTRPTRTIMTPVQAYDRELFTRIAESVNCIELPTATTTKGMELMADLKQELYDFEESIYERIQKI